MKLIGGILAAIVLMTTSVFAAKIGDITDVSFKDQAIRFIQFSDQSVLFAVIGSVLLGISCGLLGAITLVKRESLLGDTLSHAILPGIAFGFLWSLSKDPLPLLIGACLSGGLGLVTLKAINNFTKLKIDAAMGLVLTGFYGLGIVLLTMIQNIPVATQSGLDKYLFGQAAALSIKDLYYLAGVAVFSVIFVTFFYKEIILILFDSYLAKVVIKRVGLIKTVLMFLLTITIVVSAKAVGVILVSAMLVIPAATASLVSNKFSGVIFIAIVIGIVSGVMGCLLSFLANSLPTGPFMVVVAFAIFAMVFLFYPKVGFISGKFRNKDQSIH